MSHIKTTGLVGIEFDREKRHCYSLVRDFYQLNFEMELSDYAVPTNFYNTPDCDLIRLYGEQEGFEPFIGNMREYQAGDILCMAIGGLGFANHMGVWLPNGQVLHHLAGRRSEIVGYTGLVRNTTIAVLRHPSVPTDQNIPIVDINELLPLHVRRRLQNS